MTETINHCKTIETKILSSAMKDMINKYSKVGINKIVYEKHVWRILEMKLLINY